MAPQNDYSFKNKNGGTTYVRHARAHIEPITGNTERKITALLKKEYWKLSKLPSKLPPGSSHITNSFLARLIWNSAKTVYHVILVPRFLNKSAEHERLDKESFNYNMKIHINRIVDRLV